MEIWTNISMIWKEGELMEGLTSKKFGFIGIIILLLGILISSNMKTVKKDNVVLVEPDASINSINLLEEQREINESCIVEPENNIEKVMTLKKVFEIPLLMYHSIAYEAKNELRVPKEKFEEQMKFLKEHGFTAISMKEAYEIINNEKLSPEKPIVICFDDGYADNYSNAYPILMKYNLRGTIFVITDTVDKSSQYLSSSQIREMYKSGIDFQSHTVHHEELNRLSYAKQLKTLRQSKEYLESCLGSRVIALSYPVGKYNNDTIKAAKDTGYLMAVTTKFGFAKKKDGMFTLTRVRINASDSLQSFSAKIKTSNKKSSTEL